MCSPKKKKLTADQIAGTWTNVSLDITMKTANGDSLLVADEGQWEEILNIKPIVTTYIPGGIFKSEYYTLEDQLFHTAYGKWEIRNDSLVLTTENEELAYFCEIDNEKAAFRALMDWDQDGQRDDIYAGVQIRTE